MSVITIRTADGRTLGVVSRRTGKMLPIRDTVEARRVQRLALARHGITTEVRRGNAILSGFQRGMKTKEPASDAPVSVYAPPTDEELAEIEEIG